MKLIKNFLKIIFLVIIIVIIIFCSIILINTIYDYNPAQEIVLINENTNIANKADTCEFSIISWNIGYCGLGSEMDFFYEGGDNVKPSKELYNKYLNGISKCLSNYSFNDFILLQECDICSKRTYKTDQFKYFSSTLSDFWGFNAINYDVKFIPFPLTNPMGRVKSGIANFSKFKPYSVVRYSLPGSYSWPKNIFFLDRCILISKFNINNKNLVIINLHNSAFDDADYIRENEMNYIKNIMISEYKKGNYVIAAGDWNINPYGFSEQKINKNFAVKTVTSTLTNNFFDEGWQWVYDNKIPSNRDVNSKYEPNKTLTTILDFFVVSPNIKIFEVKNYDLGFEFADHHPVKLKFGFNKE
ncbi:hypothetical protein EOM09_04470 [bacterium]|nr:hypothetical protein [bacterium]